MKKVTKFEAFDGSSFDSEEECKSHEASNPHLRLVGLDSADIDLAIERREGFVELADAIEAVAAKIARARRAGGQLKRKPKQAATLKAAE